MFTDLWDHKASYIGEVTISGTFDQRELTANRRLRRRGRTGYQQKDK